MDPRERSRELEEVALSPRLPQFASNGVEARELAQSLRHAESMNTVRERGAGVRLRAWGMAKDAPRRAILTAAHCGFASL